MQRHTGLGDLILEHLKANPEGLSQLAVMCKCRGYRHAHKKLLCFSVKERWLKQSYNFDEATQLLIQVLREAEMYYVQYGKAHEIKKERQRRQRLKAKVYDLVEPPQQEVVQEATRRLVSGTPDYERLRRMSPTEITTDRIEHLRRAIGISPLHTLVSQSVIDATVLGALSPHTYAERLGLPSGSLEPPEYEYVPEEVEPTEYALIEAKLEQKLALYPKSVWVNLKTERKFAGDTRIIREVQVARQAAKRALDKLEEEGQVVKEGRLTKAIYYLSNDSEE